MALPAFPLSFTWELVMHASYYRGLMQVLGAGDACQLLSRADASAWSLPHLKIYRQSKRHFLVVPFLSMYRTIFVSHDGDELPGMSNVRMVQIFLGICHFG